MSYHRTQINVPHHYIYHQSATIHDGTTSPHLTSHHITSHHFWYHLTLPCVLDIFATFPGPNTPIPPDLPHCEQWTPIDRNKRT